MTEKPWMTPKEVAVYTGLAVTTIYSKTARGEIPVHKGSGLPRYFRAEIDRWLRGESVPQGDQPAQGPARS